MFRIHWFDRFGKWCNRRQAEATERWVAMLHATGDRLWLSKERVGYCFVLPQVIDSLAYRFMNGLK
ncbi:MAG: hypothetical protein JWM42_2627 [Burkholderia sp.]|nr:hypothetical protein [Burkholderia sp.]